MKKIISVLFVLTTLVVYAQQKKVTLSWNGSKTIATDSYLFEIPNFQPEKNYVFNVDTGLEYVSEWAVRAPVNENSIAISNVTYASVSKAELKALNLSLIPVELKYSLKNARARDKSSAVFTLSPIIRSGENSFKKVTSFTINYSSSNARTNVNTRTQTITNSVLSNGSWYKFVIDKSGVFRLSKSFLNDMGINTNGLDPRTIKIYGNGGNMMPYANSANFPFDPTENAIKVVGEADGVFDNEDYILFYGQGPTGYNEISNTNLNIYTDKAYYYINIGTGAGKRVQPFAESVGAPTLTVNSFQDYKFHELDEESLAFVGRRWFGDKFDVETEKIFDFSFPNLLITEPIMLKVIGASTSGETTNFNVNVNGTSVNTIVITGASEPNLVTDNQFFGPVTVNSDDIAVNIVYDKLGNPSAVGYLDYISIEATRNLTFSGAQFEFKNNATAETAGIAQYNLANASQVSEVWDVTDIYNASSIVNADASATLSFKAPMGSLKTFVTVSSQDFLAPILAENSSVANQNLKGTIFLNEQGSFQDIDYLLLTTKTHLAQAQRLANINQTVNNLNVKVVTAETIYNEFSGGSPDISGIRNFVKYVYDNASSPENRVKYLGIFGDTSFDYKERIGSNTYNFPIWNAYSSFNLTSSFISDDFYGMMDDNEGNINSTDRLDIAVGRIIADTPQRAKEMVDKIEVYYSKEALGSWRNNFLVVSDDVDEPWEAVLQETTDQIGDLVAQEKPFINVLKIHSDSFQQEASAGGDRYPEVTEAMNNAIEKGALVVNYFGHGGEDGLAFERIFQKPDTQALRNDCRLNCFVTVTCEFTRFDNPVRETAGEFIYWNKNAGSIALITTTRQIFVTVGKDFNIILEQYLFSFSDNDTFADDEYPTMAEALRLAKTDPNFSGSQKNLVFFIGDPAMKLAFAKPDIRLTKINDVPITQQTDVLEALSYAKLSGEVTDTNGNVLTNYNGTLTTIIYDKKIERETLANDNVAQGGQLIKLQYETLGAIVFRGQASIVNGEFEFDFIVPRDIGIPVGTGKVSFYASQENSLEDITGASINTLQIGGINENAAEDNIGPTINLFMNDENFVSGGITNKSPLLMARFEDENGINTASGIGHDIVALIDGDEVNPFILNDYYLTEVDDYTKGNLSFPFRDLEPGLHTLTLKAWDVYNNSSTSELQFVVYDEKENLVIENVLNYPNPFVNYTEFWFSHNSSENLDVSVQIFTVSGKLIRTLNGQTNGAGSKSSSSTSRDIVWDGRDDFGQKIGKGTYIYKLKVHSQTTNKTVEKIEKLVIL